MCVLQYAFELCTPMNVTLVNQKRKKKDKTKKGKKIRVGRFLHLTGGENMKENVLH